MTKRYAISGYAAANVIEMMKYKRPNWTLIPKVKEADVVIFTGGADILPENYGEPQGIIRGCYYSPARDPIEVEDFKSMTYDQEAWGICRGAQLLWALNGGLLWQDVSDHAGNKHLVWTNDGQERIVNSVHHQQLMPLQVGMQKSLRDNPDMPLWNSRVVAQTFLARRKTGTIDGKIVEWRQKDDDMDRSTKALDIEAVWVPRGSNTPRWLGFQGHPEYGYKPCTDFFFELVERYA